MADPALKQNSLLRPAALFAIPSLLSLMLYILTMPTDLSWAFYSADGAELITAAATLGVPHPPGYPTFVLLGYPLVHLPLPLTIPLRFHLFSAVAMSVACGLVSLISHRLFSPGRFVTSCTAGLLCATSSLIWQQAVVAEVYALNGLMVMVTLWLLTTKRSPLLIGLSLGVAVTTHLTSLFLIPLIAVMLPWSQAKRSAIGLVLGSIPWLTIPFLAAGDSPVVWGDPTSAAGWWWLISGQLYQPNVFALTNTDLIARLRIWAPELLTQLGGLWLIFPFWRMITKKPLASESTSFYWITAGLYALYALGYRPLDAQVLLIPAILIIAVLITPLIKQLKNYGILLPFFLIGLNLSGFLAVKNIDVREKSLKALNNLPENALVITDGQDQTIFTVWYFHHVENVRSDLAIVDENLIAFDWYRARFFRSNTNLFPLQEDDLDRLIAEEHKKRPVCRLSLQPVSVDCQVP